MGTLFLNSSSSSVNGSSSTKLIAGIAKNYKSPSKLLRKKFVRCQESSNSSSNNNNNNKDIQSRKNSSWVSSLSKGRSTLISTENSAAVMEAEIAVKDLVPYNGGVGTTTITAPLIELQEGIGIVKFLRGKRLFITGATGFLAKGNLVYKLSRFIFLFMLKFCKRSCTMLNFLLGHPRIFLCGWSGWVSASF